jgi:hypothetical protein
VEAVHARVEEIEARVNDGLLQSNQNMVDALDRLDSLVDDAE